MNGVTYPKYVPTKMANEWFTPGALVTAYTAGLALLSSWNKRQANTLKGLRDDVADLQGRCNRFQTDCEQEKKRADICEADRRDLRDQLFDALLKIRKMEEKQS